MSSNALGLTVGEVQIGPTVLLRNAQVSPEYGLRNRRQMTTTIRQADEMR